MPYLIGIVLASAVALMAQREHPAQPRSMTLMAGPIDCRVNPTQVNELATRPSVDEVLARARSRVRSTGGVDGTVILDALAADRDR